MAMVNCPGCGKNVSDQAPRCPQCGAAVREELARQRRAETIGRLEAEVENLTAEQRHDDALVALRKLLALTPDRERVQARIEELTRIREEEKAALALTNARLHHQREEHRDAIMAAREVLAHDHSNVEAARILRDASEALQKVRRRLSQRIGVAAAALLLIAVVSVAALNAATVSGAKDLMRRGQFQAARAKLSECLPVLAFGKAAAFDEIATAEFMHGIARVKSVVASGDHEQANRILKGLVPPPGVSGLPSLSEVSRALKQREEFEARRTRAVNTAASRHAASQWSRANRSAAAAESAFQANAFASAADSWATGSRDLESAIAIASKLERKAAAKREAAERADRQRREEARRQEDARRQAERDRIAKAEMERAKRRVPTSDRSCFAYREARDAEQRGRYSRAAEYYEQAVGFRSREDFQGRLGVSSRWKLDGNWSNEHRFHGKRGDLVYLIVDHQEDRLTYEIRSPSGREWSIRDGHSVELDRAGTFSLVVSDRGTARYSVHVEIYDAP